MGAATDCILQPTEEASAINVLLILSHPDKGSYNHAIAERIGSALVDEGHHVDAHDLYAEHFRPVLENDEIQRRFSFDDGWVRHSQELRDAHGIVFVYPDWWGMPPAILKGWIDRLFRPGIAFEYAGDEFLPKTKRPLLSDKKAMLVSTTNESNPLSQDAILSIWRERILSYVGIYDVCVKVLYDLHNAGGAQRRTWLKEVEELATRWL